MKIKYLINLFTCLTGIIAFMSVFVHISIFVAMFFIFSTMNLYFSLIKIKRWILTALVMVVMVFYASQMTLSNLVLPLLNMLSVLLGIKFLELRLYRDHMQVTALSLFLFAGSGLVNLGVSFFVYALILLFFITFQLSFLSFYKYGEEEFSFENLKHLVLRILVIPIFALPASVVFFVLFPRTNYPLLDILNNNPKGQTGFSESVSLGDVKEIQADDGVAFRIKMQKIPDNWLYFRGIVFDVYKNGKWESTINKNPLRNSHTSQKMDFEIFMEPTGSRYLITPDKTLHVNFKDAKINERFETVVSKSINKKIRYKGEFTLDVAVNSLKGSSSYLDVDVSEKIIDYAKRFKEMNYKEDISTLEQSFKSGDFQYSLSELPTRENPLERFLFETKKGNCEFFASAMAVILRLKGFPARIVGGYKGGIYNDVDGGYYAVSYKNAHVWVEAHIEGKWERFDPTPASMDIFTAKNIPKFKLQLKLIGDQVVYYWNIFVINYDLEKQLGIIKSFKTLAPLNHIKKYMYILVFIAVGVFGVFVLLYKKRMLPEEILIKKLKRKLKISDNKRTLTNYIKAMDSCRLKDESLKIIDMIYASFYKDKDMTLKYFNEINKKIKNL